ncbi:hypothetical protein HN903_01785 [archaeon]|jgi:hypothetical protein|nr:hypothetical protein [archaeon]MBT6956471.1 hypothetical protein [archaeon]MBT7128464.1 hypothetical protein [archaeon]
MEFKIKSTRKDIIWGDKVFESDITRQAQELINTNGFAGTYIRHLSTGRSETESINLALLCLAEENQKIVGTSLNLLMKDEFCKRVLPRLPMGRILYEMLKAPHIFNISSEIIETVEFPKKYIGVDTWSNGLFGWRYREEKHVVKTNEKITKIGSEILIELQPDFVANLGSINIRYGPFNIENIRRMVDNGRTPTPFWKELFKHIFY